MNSVVVALKTAMETRHHKFWSRSLDCITVLYVIIRHPPLTHTHHTPPLPSSHVLLIFYFQKLLSSGLIRGTIMDEEAPTHPLLEKVMECIRMCSDGDDSTLLRIIKVPLFQSRMFVADSC